MAMVTGLVLIFSLTAGGVILLSRDVNRVVGNRSAANSIAFQAARSGAQEVGTGGLRDASNSETVVVEQGLARDAARSTAALLFADYGVEGTVEEVRFPEIDLVEVVVTITDAAGDVTGVGSARAESGP
jgi:predicted xylose isomerase-like sugar epimerase